MSDITEAAIENIVALGCVVQSDSQTGFWTRYTICYGGEVLLRGASRRELWIFAAGVSLAQVEAETRAQKEASLDRALNCSAVHFAELQGRGIKGK